jgi:hypothetical protein
LAGVYTSSPSLSPKVNSDGKTDINELAFCLKLGLEINEERPHDKLPYRGAWLWVGSEMIHLMELPNPDPLTGRPEHGGRDRHTCIAIQDVSKLKVILDKAGTPLRPHSSIITLCLKHVLVYFHVCIYICFCMPNEVGFLNIHT